MKSTYIPIDLIEEMKKAIQGDCVWCRLGLDHPSHSPCVREHTAVGSLHKIADVVARPDSHAQGVDNEIARFGSSGQYVLKMAVDGADRLKCWHLVYEEYLAHGYTQRKELEYRYSIHDALPDTGTFLIEHEGHAVGTVSVFPDTPLGLPADEIYRHELDEMRAAGRRVVEVGRLTIHDEYKNERAILANLFDALSLYARRVQKASDLIITVNPSHAKFYERMILFDRVGMEKGLDSVCGAPAVLLRLDLEVEELARRYAHGEGPRPEQYVGNRTMYPLVSNLKEENVRVGNMQRVMRPLHEEFMKRYFVRLRPLILDLPSPLRYFMEKCCPGYNLLSGHTGDNR